MHIARAIDRCRAEIDIEETSGDRWTARCDRVIQNGLYLEARAVHFIDAIGQIHVAIVRHGDSIIESVFARQIVVCVVCDDGNLVVTKISEFLHSRDPQFERG